MKTDRQIHRHAARRRAANRRSVRRPSTNAQEALAIKIRENADHQIGALHLLDLFCTCCRDGFHFHRSFLVCSCGNRVEALALRILESIRG